VEQGRADIDDVTLATESHSKAGSTWKGEFSRKGKIEEIKRRLQSENEAVKSVSVSQQVQEDVEMEGQEQ
jgi:hypothetical protein